MIDKNKLGKRLKRWRDIIVKSSISYNWDAIDEQIYSQIGELVNWWEKELKKYSKSRK